MSTYRLLDLTDIKGVEDYRIREAYGFERDFDSPAEALNRAQLAVKSGHFDHVAVVEVKSVIRAYETRTVEVAHLG